MSEFLGVVLGVAIGGGLSRLRSWRTRVALVVPAVLLAGVGTSAVNGELGTGLWALFVSFDTLLAGLGVAVGFAAVRLRLGLASPATSAGGPSNRSERGDEGTIGRPLLLGSHQIGTSVRR